MIKSMNVKFKTMLLITSVAALALGVLRTVILINHIEPETGFYIVETRMDTVFGICAIALVALIAFFGFVSRKAPAPEYLDSHSTVIVFSSSLCAFMFITLFLYGIYLAVTSEKTSVFFLIQVALCVPCAINHISICSNEVREKNAPHALLSMSEAVFFAVRIIEAFLDTATQINTSQRSLELVMLCSMMLFALLEARIQIKTDEIKNDSIAKYFVFALATVAFTIVAALPYLCVSLFWCFEADFIVMDVLECCIMVFAASRLLTLK